MLWPMFPVTLKSPPQMKILFFLSFWHAYVAFFLCERTNVILLYLHLWVFLLFNHRQLQLHGQVCRASESEAQQHHHSHLDWQGSTSPGSAGWTAVERPFTLFLSIQRGAASDFLTAEDVNGRCQKSGPGHQGKRGCPAAAWTSLWHQFFFYFLPKKYLWVKCTLYDHL